jgi:hypothetical protein
MRNDYYFEGNPGWMELVAEAVEECERANETFVVDQVKQKFGGLRLYYHLGEGSSKDDHKIIDAIIARAELKAIRTCEFCGATEAVTTGPIKPPRGWFYTACEECRHAKAE